MAVKSTSGADRTTVFNYCSIYTSGSSSIRDSYNTSSITEHNTSNYQIFFTNSAGNSNYSVAVNVDVETNQWANTLGSGSYRISTGGGLGSSIVCGIVFQN